MVTDAIKPQKAKGGNMGRIMYRYTVTIAMTLVLLAMSSETARAGKAIKYKTVQGKLSECWTAVDVQVGVTLICDFDAPSI